MNEPKQDTAYWMNECKKMEDCRDVLLEFVSECRFTGEGGLDQLKTDAMQLFARALKDWNIDVRAPRKTDSPQEKSQRQAERIEAMQTEITFQTGYGAGWLDGAATDDVTSMDLRKAWAEHCQEVEELRQKARDYYGMK
jgi:hypothetical protein